MGGPLMHTQKLHDRLRWERELLANPHIEAGDKVAMPVLMDEFTEQGIGFGTPIGGSALPIDFDITSLAERAGMPQPVFGEHLQRLADMGAIRFAGYVHEYTARRPWR